MYSFLHIDIVYKHVKSSEKNLILTVAQNQMMKFILQISYHTIRITEEGNRSFNFSLSCTGVPVNITLKLRYKIKTNTTYTKILKFKDETKAVQIE